MRCHHRRLAAHAADLRRLDAIAVAVPDIGRDYLRNEPEMAAHRAAM